jgi:hypothetical protein
MENKMEKGYYVSDVYRTNHLSLKPGGYKIEVIYEDHFRVYDKIKYPQSYIEKIVERDNDIIEVKLEGSTCWKKS